MVVVTEDMVDALTGLPNRQALNRSLEARSDMPTHVVIMDIRNFMPMNHAYGYLKCDEVLVHLGKVLGAIADGRTQVFRLGGDEFIGLSQDEDGASLWQRLHDVAAAVRDPGGDALRFSAGEAAGPLRMELIAAADNDRYQRFLETLRDEMDRGVPRFPPTMMRLLNIGGANADEDGR